METFEELYDRRNTSSVKWDLMEKVYGIKDASGILPMWVADMDFPAPPAVTAALKERLDHPIFGYTFEGEKTRSSVRNWLRDRHGWETKSAWMLFRHGVIPAMAEVIDSFSSVGDQILVTPPVYPPFFSLPEKLEREVIFCELTETEGRYTLNFDKLDKALQGAAIFLLCNPHNPGGIVWSREELEQIIHLCAKHDVLILSDEIHSDLVLDTNRHIPAASVAGEELFRIITCVAPTKTFNLASLQASVMIVPDPEKRKKLEAYAAAHGHIFISALGATAMQAAYDHGAPWLEELRTILSGNMDTAIRELTSRVPGLRIQKPGATYLLWIDYRELGMTEKEAMKLLLTKGKVALEPGTKYGPGGDGFLRMNVACPRPVLEDGIQRIVQAFAK